VCICTEERSKWRLGTHLLCWGDQIRDSMMGVACSMHGVRNKCKIFVRIPEVNNPFGTPLDGWKDNIDIDFK
jgi:hypothetical protein